MTANYRSLLTKESWGGNCYVHDWTGGVWITERWTHTEIFTPTNVGCVLHGFLWVSVCLSVYAPSHCVYSSWKWDFIVNLLMEKMIAKQFVFYNVQLFLFALVCHFRRKNENCVRSVCCWQLPIDFHTSFSRCTLEIFRFWDNVG